MTNPRLSIKTQFVSDDDLTRGGNDASSKTGLRCIISDRCCGVD